MKGKCGQEPSLWFPWEGIVEAGQSGLGWVSLHHFNGLWDVRGAPSFLVHVSRVQGNSVPECKILMKAVVGGRDSGLVDLHLKASLAGLVCGLSGNETPGEGQSLQDEQGLKMLKH